jgi:hypothetical protein
MNARIAAGLILLVLPTVPSTAAAWPLLDVTSSEVISVHPPRVKTTFTVVEQGSLPPGWCGWAWFEVTPQDPGAPGAVQIFGCEAPQGGQCDLGDYAGVPVAVFSPHQGDGGMLPANTYSIVTDQAEPCVRFDFLCIVLMGAVPPIETCLLVDMPVPAAPSSWGAVKSRYR